MPFPSGGANSTPHWRRCVLWWSRIMRRNASRTSERCNSQFLCLRAAPARSSKHRTSSSLRRSRSMDRSQSSQFHTNPFCGRIGGRKSSDGIRATSAAGGGGEGLESSLSLDCVVESDDSASLSYTTSTAVDRAGFMRACLYVGQWDCILS